MRKLLYNIYSTIKDDEYFEIEKKMLGWQKEMLSVIPISWQITVPVEKNDALIIDFTIEENSFYGNIGVSFEDTPGKFLFSLGVTKSFDEKDVRYFLKDCIFENTEDKFFEKDILKLTKLALKRYNNWSKEDIINQGIKFNCAK